jgi:indolepyruvate decarboxylase
MSRPAIIGAKIAAAPDRRAVLFIGDGSAQLTIQELGTMARRGMNATIFLINKDGYTVERAINGWNATYNEIAQWDWAQLTSAFGAKDAVVARASTLAELNDALSTCESTTGKITFVEIVLDRHDLPRLLAELSKAVTRQND